ncbi:hypothetical protein BC941DRAFT_470844 [Chlamydoabsidia padenii]|nr:hypothetical protein BC941DRAFT_470844 [Chlamydoabsidia padenii]
MNGDSHDVDCNISIETDTLIIDDRHASTQTMDKNGGIIKAGLGNIAKRLGGSFDDINMGQDDGNNINSLVLLSSPPPSSNAWNLFGQPHGHYTISQLKECIDFRTEYQQHLYPLQNGRSTFPHQLIQPDYSRKKLDNVQLMTNDNIDKESMSLSSDQDNQSSPWFGLNQQDQY